jgi:cupin 2 domain-containing protein
MPLHNLFSAIPPPVKDELSNILVDDQHIRIERIVSHGHASPPGFWYDQEEAEWVIVLKGRALLAIEGDAPPVALAAGDYLNIPPHCRHRVEWTDPETDTVWLAVFYH